MSLAVNDGADTLLAVPAERTMYLFCDESGDTGFVFRRGSSNCFVMVAVHFAGVGEMEDCEKRLAKLREVLGWLPSRDFHFSDCSDRERAAFFKVAAACPLTYFVTVVEKTRMQPLKELYQDTAEQLVRLVNDHVPLRRAKLVFDTYGGRTTEQKLRRRLLEAFNPRKRRKKRIGHQAIDSVRAKRAGGDSLIQIADMLSGAWLLREKEKEEGAAYLKTMERCLVARFRLPT